MVLSASENNVRDPNLTSVKTYLPETTLLSIINLNLLKYVHNKSKYTLVHN